MLGVDPAAGGDNSAIELKSATLQEILFNQKLENTMDLVGVVMDLYRKHGVAQIIVDNTGVAEAYMTAYERQIFLLKRLISAKVLPTKRCLRIRRPSCIGRNENGS